MSKSIKRGLFNGSVVIATGGAVGATSAIIIQTNQLHPNEVKRIIDEIKEQINQVNNTINKLDQNKDSVDSLKIAIDEAEQKLAEFNQKFDVYNKEEYKTNNKINNEIEIFKNSISELEANIKDSKSRYEQNKSTFDKIYEEAKETSDQAKKQLKETSEIDKPGLQAADDKLQQAIQKVEQAKQKVQDSQSHVDNLSTLNEELKQATDEVKKLIEELKNLNEEQKNNKYLQAINNVTNDLNDKINKSSNLVDNIKEIEDFITDLQTSITKANSTVKIVESEKGLSESVLAASEHLKDIISQSEQTLKNAKTKLAVISNNIDQKLNELKTQINDSKQKITNSTDFDELSKEFENYNITDQSIKDLETKIKQAEYNQGLEVIEQLKIDNENNKSASLDKMKSAITKVLEAANNLNEEQIENFSVKINLANNPQELSNIRDEINVANKKEQYKKLASTLQNLSENEINEFNSKINESNESDLEKIKEEYSKINDDKAKLIEEINTFDFTDEYKNQLANNIKSQNLNAATSFKEEIKQINDSKTNVKEFIDNPENQILENKKTELKDLLTKAQSQVDVQNVQNKAQLEKTRQNAIDEISKLNVENKEQLIDQINKKDDEAGIRSIVAKAKGDVLESEKLEAESKIRHLDFISDSEKSQKINQIKNTTNTDKDQIDKIVEELTNKNKEKQDLFDKNIKDNDLFTNEFIDETKNQLVNEDNNDKYNKIKNDFAALKTQKEDLIKKLDDNATYPNLGQKDKENLKNKLKQASDIESIKEVEKQTSQLNTEKQKLISEVDKLEKVDADKATTKEQIINANGKDEAQKIYDQLKVKSNKEKAKAEINALQYLNNAEKQNSISQINKINTNIQNVQSILDTTKQKDSTKKTYHDSLEAFKSSFNDSLINAKKQEIKNSDLNISKSIYDKLKQMHDKMTADKDSAKNAVDGEFNKKPIGIDHRKYYKALADKVKYLDSDLNTNSNSYLSTLEDIKYSAKWQTELFIHNTGRHKQKYKLLLNNNEVQSAVNKVNQIRAKSNNVATLETLNELKTALQEVENLHKEKEQIKDKFNSLTAIKTTLRENAKNNVKNITKEEANSKFTELNELNSQIVNAHNKLDGSEFEKLSPDRIQYYKEKIGNIDNKDQIQEILNNAKDEIDLNQNKKLAKEQIDKLQNVSSSGKIDFKNKIDKANSKNDVDNILKQAQNIENNKKLLIDQINSALTTKQITQNAKNDLISRLKTDDSDGVKNSIQTELDKWKANYQPHQNAISTLNKVKELMQNMLTNNKDPKLSTQVEKFKKFINDNSLNNTDKVANLEAKKNKLYGTDLTSNINELNKAITNSFDNYKNTFGDKVKDKSELNKLKQTIKDDINKLNSIKKELNKTFTNGLIIDSEFTKTTDKSNELERWISEKVGLVDKHNTLINSVNSSNSLSDLEKRDLINKINNERVKTSHLTQEYNQLANEINTKIQAANKISVDYNDSLWDIKQRIEDLKLHNTQITNQELKNKNNQLITHLESQVAKYTNEYRVNINNKTIAQKGIKLKKAKEIVEKYVDTIKEGATYMSTRAENEQIKTAGWNEFLNSSNQYDKDLFNGLTTANLENYEINSYNVNHYMPLILLDAKREVFKKEIIRLIGDGKWRMPNINWKQNNEAELLISFMYIENARSRTNAEPKLDGNHYRSKYNFVVNWNTQSASKLSYAEGPKVYGYYDYHAYGISFSTGDNDGIEFGLMIDKDANKINFHIQNNYDNNKYWSAKGNERKTHIYDVNINKGRNITENDLSIIVRS